MLRGSRHLGKILGYSLSTIKFHLSLFGSLASLRTWRHLAATVGTSRKRGRQGVQKAEWLQCNLRALMNNNNNNNNNNNKSTTSSFISCRFGSCAVLRRHKMAACTSRWFLPLPPNAGLRLCRSLIDSAMIILVFSYRIAVWMAIFLARHVATVRSTGPSMARDTQFEKSYPRLLRFA
jgi:hypothetical protein